MNDFIFKIKESLRSLQLKRVVFVLAFLLAFSFIVNVVMVFKLSQGAYSLTTDNTRDDVENVMQGEEIVQEKMTVKNEYRVGDTLSENPLTLLISLVSRESKLVYECDAPSNEPNLEKYPGRYVLEWTYLANQGSINISSEDYKTTKKVLREDDECDMGTVDSVVTSPSKWWDGGSLQRVIINRHFGDTAKHILLGYKSSTGGKVEKLDDFELELGDTYYVGMEILSFLDFDHIIIREENRQTEGSDPETSYYIAPIDNLENRTIVAF